MLCVISSEERRYVMERLHIGPLQPLIKDKYIEPVRVANSLTEILEGAFEHHYTFLLIDIQVWEREAPDIRHSLLDAFHSLHPLTNIILLHPRDVSPRALAHALVEGRHFQDVLTYEEMARADTWFSLIRKTQPHHIKHVVKETYQQACRRLDAERMAPAWDYLNIIMVHAPESPTVGSLVRRIVSDGSIMTPTRLTRTLQHSGQFPPLCVLFMFRLVYYIRLLEMNWSRSEIAQFLSFSDPRELNRCVRRTWNLRAEDAQKISFDRAIEWAAAITVVGRQSDAVTIKELIQQL